MKTRIRLAASPSSFPNSQRRDFLRWRAEVLALIPTGTAAVVSFSMARVISGSSVLLEVNASWALATHRGDFIEVEVEIEVEIDWCGAISFDPRASFINRRDVA
jgi:hypothetical protein